MAIVYYLFYPYVYCPNLQKIYSSIFEFVVNIHRSTAVDLNFDLNFQLYLVPPMRHAEDQSP
jgi:hypothetical protein